MVSKPLEEPGLSGICRWKASLPKEAKNPFTGLLVGVGLVSGSRKRAGGDGASEVPVTRWHWEDNARG